MDRLLIERFGKNAPEVLQRQARLRRFWSGENIGRPPLSLIPYSLSPRQMFDNPDQQLDCHPFLAGKFRGKDRENGFG